MAEDEIVPAGTGAVEPATVPMTPVPMSSAPTLPAARFSPISCSRKENLRLGHELRRVYATDIRLN